MVIVTVSTGDVRLVGTRLTVTKSLPWSLVLWLRLWETWWPNSCNLTLPNVSVWLRPTLQVNCIVLAQLPVIESRVMLTIADKEADGQPMASIIASPSSGIIFTSPEVITKVGHPLQQALSHLPVVLFAIDEAHKVSEWGVSDDLRFNVSQTEGVPSWFCKARKK
jgi:hypothetical protein